MPPIINTSFLVVSDTHGVDIHENTAHAFSLPLPKVDVILHCGDLTQVGGHGPYRKALKMLGEIDAELKLVIAGNHDLELDGDYWRTHLDEEGGDEPEEHEQAVAIMRGPLAKETGVTYLEEGTHTFTLKNGASFSIFVSPYTPAFGDWAFGAAPSENRFANLQDHIDIMMTHGPPKNILDLCPDGNVGCNYALDALRHTINARPAEIDKTERWHKICNDNPNETLAINAAIRGDNGTFCYSPWLVTLLLRGPK
ncbi:Metallo-dependent phosphatase [Aureobasidium sp. EXF-10728]|nr:Metallo-dependent phosphatase [Aureobasidium sp. EXF-10728]